MRLSVTCSLIPLPVLLAGGLALLMGHDAQPQEARTVSAGGHRFTVKLVRFRLSQVRIKVGLAHGFVGRTESLEGIARRYGAVAAVNGCFFDAYTSNPIKNPHHTLITNGGLVHKGNVGSLIGFTADGDARIERVPLKIEGALDGKWRYPDNWYGYWINRYPEGPNTVTIFTPAWGPRSGMNDGLQVTVAGGEVTGVGQGSGHIPGDGYVIYFRGSEEKLAQRFRTGRKCEYRIVRQDGADLGFWAQVKEAIGAGPRLVTEGRITVDPVAEGFSHAKILSASGSRSMVGLTQDGWLILATSNGTIRQMAEVMKSLGAFQAMNLDGGASSGLWVRGKYLTRPGRLISNALMVLP